MQQDSVSIAFTESSESPGDSCSVGVELSGVVPPISRQGRAMGASGAGIDSERSIPHTADNGAKAVVISAKAVNSGIVRYVRRILSIKAKLRRNRVHVQSAYQAPEKFRGKAGNASSVCHGVTVITPRIRT